MRTVAIAAISLGAVVVAVGIVVRFVADADTGRDLIIGGGIVVLLIRLVSYLAHTAPQK